MLSCPVGWAEDEGAAPLDASTAVSMSDRIVVSSPIGGRLIAELSMSGFAGLFASLQHAAQTCCPCEHSQHDAKPCQILDLYWYRNIVGRQTQLSLMGLCCHTLDWS